VFIEIQTNIYIKLGASIVSKCLYRLYVNTFCGVKTA